MTNQERYNREVTFQLRYSQAAQCASFTKGKCLVTGPLCRIAHFTDRQCTYFDTHIAPPLIKEEIATYRTCNECQKRFKGVGRSAYCSEVCRKIRRSKTNRKHYVIKTNTTL
ncbi:hypothetical protein SAMN05428962_2368 [Paenibacillus sp. BC26]|nr:hypothetical protein SAMN05428962_2368 [Paenibacillus sp. BC26]